MEQQALLDGEAVEIRALRELCPEQGECRNCAPSGECLAKVRSVEFHERLKVVLNDSHESDEVVEARYDRFEDVWSMGLKRQPHGFDTDDISGAIPSMVGE